jgi:hypothetical protein
MSRLNGIESHFIRKYWDRPGRKNLSRGSLTINIPLPEEIYASRVGFDGRESELAILDKVLMEEDGCTRVDVEALKPRAKIRTCNVTQPLTRQRTASHKATSESSNRQPVDELVLTRVKNIPFETKKNMAIFTDHIRAEAGRYMDVRMFSQKFGFNFDELVSTLKTDSYEVVDRCGVLYLKGFSEVSGTVGSPVRESFKETSQALNKQPFIEDDVGSERIRKQSEDLMIVNP